MIMIVTMMMIIIIFIINICSEIIGIFSCLFPQKTLAEELKAKMNHFRSEGKKRLADLTMNARRLRGLEHGPVEIVDLPPKKGDCP